MKNIKHCFQTCFKKSPTEAQLKLFELLVIFFSKTNQSFEFWPIEFWFHKELVQTKSNKPTIELMYVCAHVSRDEEAIASTKLPSIDEFFIFGF